MQKVAPFFGDFILESTLALGYTKDDLLIARDLPLQFTWQLASLAIPLAIIKHNNCLRLFGDKLHRWQAKPY